jgi:hypothetical protein
MGSDSKLLILCDIKSVFQLSLFICQPERPSSIDKVTMKAIKGNGLGLKE